MTTFIPFCLFGLAGFIPKALAATTAVFWENGIGTELRDSAGNVLTQGTAAFGDGTILQMGYYSLATTDDPFAGYWISLQGPGSPYDYRSRIGDKLGVDGLFDSEWFSHSEPFLLPTTGRPLTVRFFDNTSIGASTFFNAVSNTTGTWNWVNHSSLISYIHISLSDPGLVWQGGSGSAYRTTIAIPEPSCGIILTLATGLLATRRRRMKSIA